MGRRGLAVLVATCGAILIGSVMTPLLASNPPSDTVTVPPNDGGTTTITWKGTIPVGQSGDPANGGTCPGQPNPADEHRVKVEVPTNFYASKSASFTFSITWDPNNPTGNPQLNDEVLTVRNAAGAVIGNSDGSTTTEKADLANLLAGEYVVQACGFVNTTAQDYTGKLVVTTQNGAASPNVLNDNLMTFTDATVVDPILFGGEPGINFDNTRSNDGTYSFVDWPVSSRVNIGVLFRSDDGGLSYRKRYADPTDVANAGGPCAGRQVPTCLGGGGGDTDVHVEPKGGRLYFSSQESLAAQLVAVSLDHGDTFPATNSNPIVSVPCTGVDRQWLTSIPGTDTAFLAYHIPLAGECLAKTTDAGKTWIPQPLATTNVTQSGAMVVDNSGGPTQNFLYITYNTSLLAGTSGSLQYGIAVSKDQGATWTSRVIPKSKNLRNFNKLQVDNAGNLYATWVDSVTQHTWLSTSKADTTNPALTWSDPVQVDADPVHVSIFPDVVAGSPGRVAVSYYGTTAKAKTPDDVQPGTNGWYPFVSYADNALCQWDATPCARPAFHQSAISHTINHDDNICTSGTTCIVLPSPSHPGNRNLLDYFDISVDKQGHLGFVWSDTRNATGLPFVKVARQATGPSLFVGSPKASWPKRRNGEADARGDALWPIAGAKVKTAPNKPGLDLTGATLSLVNPDTLQVRIGVADSTKIGDVPGVSPSDDTVVQQAKYIARWDFDGHAYYAGANVAPGGGATPAFFAGEVSTAEALSAPASTSPYGNVYKPLLPATGRIEGNDLVIEVPTKSIGAPTLNSPVYSVGAYSMLGPTDAVATLFTAPVTVDSTPTFDTALSGPAAPAIREARGGGSTGANTSGAQGGRGGLPASGSTGSRPALGLAAAIGAAVLYGVRRRLHAGR
jgi:hypothetical protein